MAEEPDDGNGDAEHRQPWECGAEGPSTETTQTWNPSHEHVLDA
jgi:hypothetical protein